jgi:hypothetical protein
MAGTVAWLLVTSQLLGPVLGALIDLPSAGRVVIAALAIAPIGFLLGMPLPAGLRAIQPRDPALVPWAWAINGVASVAAPAVATLSALYWGFQLTFLVGASAYVAAGVLLPRRDGSGPSTSG